MATTAWKVPGHLSTYGTGDDVWFDNAGTTISDVNTANAGGVDDLSRNDSEIVGFFAFKPPAASPVLRAANFSFGVPAGATIDGVEYRITRNVSISSGSATCVEQVLQLVTAQNATAASRAGDRVGSNKASATAWPSTNTPTTFTAATYGGAADKWGATLTDTIVNSAAFGVDLSVYVSAGASSTAAATLVEMRVHYTASGGGLSSGKIKTWNGSAWVEKPIKWWNGSAWVEKPLKVWSGSAWVLA
jgi:hypothetical protein